MKTEYVVMRHQLTLEAEQTIQAAMDGLDFTCKGQLPESVRAAEYHAPVEMCVCQTQTVAELVAKALGDFTFDYDHFYSVMAKTTTMDGNIQFSPIEKE